jgi:hypothetical protein
MRAYNELHVPCSKSEARFLITKFKELIRNSLRWSLVEAKYSDDFAQGIDVAKDLVLMLYHLDGQGNRYTCLFMSYNDDPQKCYLEVNNICGDEAWLNQDVYNQELEDLRRDIIRPSLSISFQCEIINHEEESLKVIPTESIKLLKAFTTCINWESPHHKDMERWNDFVISVVCNGRPNIPDTIIRNTLIEMKAPERAAAYWADRFVWEYWLLCKYDAI